MKKLILPLLILSSFIFAGNYIQTNNLTCKSSIDTNTIYYDVAYDSTKHTRAGLVAMYGYNSTKLNIDTSMRNRFCNAESVFVICPELRGRGSSTGTADDGARECYDIFDVVQDAKARYKEFFDTTNINFVGYSGGGGNAVSTAVKFPEHFGVFVDHFGITDYGYDSLQGWYKYAEASLQAIALTRIGGTTVAVPDNWWCRANRLGLVNNSKSHFYVYHDTADAGVNIIHSLLLEHLWDSLSYTNYDFTLTTPDSAYRAIHGYPIVGTQGEPTIHYEQFWFPTIRAGTYKTPTMDATGNLVIQGYVRTKKYQVFLGTGESDMVTATYNTAGAIPILTLSNDKTANTVNAQLSYYGLPVDTLYKILDINTTDDDTIVDYSRSNTNGQVDYTASLAANKAYKYILATDASNFDAHWDAAAADRWTALNFDIAREPVETDSVIFDTTGEFSTVACTLATVANIKAFTVDSTYKGYFKAIAGGGINVRGPVSVKPGGTFDFGSDTIRVTGNKDFILKNYGTYMLDSTTVILDGTGNLTIDKASVGPKNLTVAATGKTTTNNSAATIILKNGTLNIGAGTLTNNGTLAVNVIGQAVPLIVHPLATINGNANLQLNLRNTTRRSISIPALTHSGTGTAYFNIARPAAISATCTVNVAGTQNTGNSFAISGGSDSVVYNTNSYPITTSGAFNVSVTAAPYSVIYNAGSSVHSVGSFGQGADGTNAGVIFNMGPSSWTCAGSWKFWAGTVCNPSTFSLTMTGASTLTSNSKRLGNLTINNPSTGTFKSADSINCNGNFTLTDGRDTLAFPVSCVDFTCNSADTSFIATPVWWTGNALFAALAKPFWQTGKRFVANGTGTQTLTTNNQILPVLTHKNSGLLRPLDSLNCDNILDSSSGTFDQDFGTRCSTAVYKGTDSVAMSGNMEIINNLSFGLQTRENITGNIKWLGAGTAILADSGTQLADVTVAKTAGVIWQTAGVAKSADLTLTSGKAIIGVAATDTVYCVDFVANNTGAGDSVVLNAPLVVSGAFSTAATVKWGNTAAGKIISTGIGSTIALNGNTTMPPIVLNDRASITGGGTIARLSFGVDGKKITFAANTAYTLTAWDSSDFNGVSGSRDSLVSSTPGTRFRLILPAADTLAHFYSQDCSTSVIVRVDSTGRTGGNNRNMRYLRNLVATPATGPAAGGTPFTLTGRGLVGGGALFGTAAATSWTVASNLSASGVSPAGSGAVTLRVYSSDCGYSGDTVTVAGGWIYISPVSPNRLKNNFDFGFGFGF